ncbi:MAG: T9SS type A sorting domain-containing protein [Bacteroidia bacterium]
MDLRAFESVTEVPATSSAYHYLDQQVRPHQRYYYVVVAKGAQGEERLRSNIAQAQLVSDFHAYLLPNPTRGYTHLILSMPEADSVEVRVHNAVGQLVWLFRGYFEAGSPQVPLPSGEWAAGVYAVEVRTRRYHWSGKLLRE